MWQHPSTCLERVCYLPNSVSMWSLQPESVTKQQHYQVIGKCIKSTHYISKVPISLLCSLCSISKIFECLMLNNVIDFIRLKISKSQFGFLMFNTSFLLLGNMRVCRWQEWKRCCTPRLCKAFDSVPQKNTTSLQIMSYGHNLPFMEVVQSLSLWRWFRAYLYGGGSEPIFMEVVQSLSLWRWFRAYLYGGGSEPIFMEVVQSLSLWRWFRAYLYGGGSEPIFMEVVQSLSCESFILLCINNTSSNLLPVYSVVPQGSVLGQCCLK